MKRFAIALVILASVLTGCGDNSKSKVQGMPQCPELPVKDGFVTVKTVEGGLTLRLPVNAGISRDPKRGCEYATSVSLDYLWYEGKLIYEAPNRFKVPSDKRMEVRLFPQVDVKQFVGLTTNLPHPPEGWRYQPGLKHERFPLVYYPRFNWASESGATYEYQKSGSWGISGTQHKDVRNGEPFHAWCSIQAADSSRPDSHIKGDFAKYGDSKCRGWIIATKNDKALGAMIDVWASGAPEINHIYDAAVEQLQSFIQE